MKIEKIKAYLGFSIRSGEMIFGSDNIYTFSKKPKLVLICSLQNEKVTNKVINFCNKNDIKFLKLEDIVLADLVGRDNCKVVGITDENLANAIIKEFEMGSK